MRSPAEVRDAAALLRTPLPAALWDDLRSEGLLPAPGAPTGAPAPGER
ncbi:hypothetical protein [Streptomyces sp. NPDC002690]